MHYLVIPTNKTNKENEMNYANMIGYSDITPFEIIRHVSDKTIDVRRMQYKKDDSVKLNFHTGGFAANCSNQNDQEWIINSDETSDVIRIRLGKQGWKSSDGARFQLDIKPVRFYDYNF